MEFALVPAGEFVMGSPESEQSRDLDEEQHAVRISRPFLMGVHPVTRGQFATFVEDSGYRTEAEKEGSARTRTGNGFEDVEGASWRNPGPGFEQTDDHPVVCVSWNDAVAFCEWLSRKEGKTYRLPTEAEWEYACRAGTTDAWTWGDEPSVSAYPFTAPVGSFGANAWGLYDMNGNVCQWCSDWYDDQFPGDTEVVTDPTGASSGVTRVLRGAPWFAGLAAWRSANRYHIPPGRRDSFVGFRIVQSS